MKKKIILIILVIAVVVLALAFKDKLIRSYVSLCGDRLEAYASAMLDNGEGKTDKYGFWNTSSYPEDGMVEFMTGGSGLAPGSTYKGFYYSADNTHKVFSAAYKDAVSMEIDGDIATWTDGTDNHGSSVRITDKWFWFEASF